MMRINEFNEQSNKTKLKRTMKCLINFFAAASDFPLLVSVSHGALESSVALIARSFNEFT